MATGTSFALPLPMPMRPSPSPTTVRAAKPRMRPPFTTLVTRLIPIIFSRRPSPRSSCCCCRPPCRCWAISIYALELEAAGARRFGERLHTAMKPVTGTIERHRLDAERLRFFGDALADHLGRRPVAAGLGVLAHLRFQRGRAREHLVALGRDDLRVDVMIRAADHETRSALLRDADA